MIRFNFGDRGCTDLVATSSSVESCSRNQSEEPCRIGFSQYVWEVQLNGLLDNRNIAHKFLTWEAFDTTLKGDANT
ncbi:MAG TPA: hypothetical protein VMW34_14420, partial [Anaerolineales bacterium]|nr:hypothetical protein [Anaerolineales bacterium]